MFDVILIIIAVGFILRTVKAKKDQAEKQASENTSGTRTTQPIQPTRKTSMTTFANRTTSNIRVNEAKNENKFKQAIINKKALVNKAFVDSPDEPRTGEAVTDYLARKSHEDDVARKKDEWEDRREEEKNVGNLRMATRLQFGSAVPRGNKLIICSYCGAENMISMASHEKYHCYFCRTSLPRN